MFRLNPGERVKLMDDTVNYTVIASLSGGKVLVSTDDGLEFPVQREDLILSSVESSDITSPSAFKNSGKGRRIVKKKSLPHSRSRQKVVDLHLPGPPDRTAGTTAIELQLIRFRSELDAAIRDGYHEITFIHGVGNGILKEELRKMLLSNYPLLSYHDGNYTRYGYGGATRVQIKK